MTIVGSDMTVVNEINVQRVKEMLNADETILILDQRDQQSYQQGHINGAMMVHDSLIDSLIRKGNKKQSLLIYCYQGNASKDLAELFCNFGFNAFSISGGYAEWKRVYES